MPPQTTSLIDRLAERRALRLWARAADGADSADISALRDLRGRARRTKAEIDRLLHKADGRLALPAIGSNAMDRPLGADWAWRPDLWRFPIAPQGHAGAPSPTALGDQVTLFHDCPLVEVTLRQRRNTRQGDLAPFGLMLEVLGFQGSFLSLAVDLPGDAVADLQRRHIIRAQLEFEAERPVTIIGRLNVKHGPNTEQSHAQVSSDWPERAMDFDLTYTDVNEKRVEKMWLDLIVEQPAMNAISLRDLTFSRRPRAEM